MQNINTFKPSSVGAHGDNDGLAREDDHASSMAAPSSASFLRGVVWGGDLLDAPDDPNQQVMEVP